MFAAGRRHFRSDDINGRHRATRKRTKSLLRRLTQLRRPATDDLVHLGLMAIRFVVGAGHARIEMYLRKACADIVVHHFAGLFHGRRGSPVTPDLRAQVIHSEGDPLEWEPRLFCNGSHKFHEIDGCLTRVAIKLVYLVGGGFDQQKAFVTGSLKHRGFQDEVVCRANGIDSGSVSASIRLTNLPELLHSAAGRSSIVCRSHRQITRSCARSADLDLKPRNTMESRPPDRRSLSQCSPGSCDRQSSNSASVRSLRNALRGSIASPAITPRGLATACSPFLTPLVITLLMALSSPHNRAAFERRQNKLKVIPFSYPGQEFRLSQKRQIREFCIFRGGDLDTDPADAFRSNDLARQQPAKVSQKNVWFASNGSEVGRHCGRSLQCNLRLDPRGVQEIAR